MRESFADIDSKLADLLADVADDFRARLAKGETPSADEYVAKYPDAADEIRGVLSIVRLAVGLQSSQTPEQASTATDRPQGVGTSVSSGHEEVTRTVISEEVASAMEPAPMLTDFTLLGFLGKGGMGQVYHVRDALDREFALKVMKSGQLSEAGKARFWDEARAMAKLDHPHVARIHHYGLLNDEQPYFTMPVYPASLHDRLAEYQADPKKAIRLMAAVAEGVGHLHARGYIHRDLKPLNILIDEKGQPAVSDFGLVKDVSDSTPGDPLPGGEGSAETKPSGAKRSRTMVGAAVGTRAYMSPEQAAGLTHLANPKWDVWALGVILHQLLTGQLPKSSEAPERLLDPKKAICLMAAVAEGVAHLHFRGYIHRDLKPLNILIDEKGQPAVSDFGLVKDVSDSTPGDPLPGGEGSAETKPSGANRSRTMVAAAVGTRAYMSPEQAAGLTHLANPKWDVWASA